MSTVFFPEQKSFSVNASSHVCTQCGACCAYYRVSFYWAESENMPEQMVQQLSPFHACMRGTNQAQPRCVALQGEIGQSVQCAIYPQRSSSCQSVQVGDAQCSKARQAHGLVALQSECSTAAADSAA